MDAIETAIAAAFIPKEVWKAMKIIESVPNYANIRKLKGKK